MKTLLSLLICSVLLFGCSKKESNTPDGNIVIRASAINGTNKNMTFKTEAGDVQITDFRIAFREIKFYHSQTDSASKGNKTVWGPFIVDLLDSNSVVTQTLDSTTIPQGDYREVRFKLHKSKELADTNELYNRSIYIAGTVDSIPFVMWHDTDENFDIKSNTGVVVSGDTFTVDIQFDIDQFFNAEYLIDLTESNDGNKDGVIEINPWDDDGNKEIAHKLKHNVKKAAKLIEGF